MGKRIDLPGLKYLHGVVFSLEFKSVRNGWQDRQTRPTFTMLSLRDICHPISAYVLSLLSYNASIANQPLS
jgi:hypothetical protein